MFRDAVSLLCSRAGPPPAARLAARLVPRYAPGFPALLSRSVETLVRLSTPVPVTQACGVGGPKSAAELAAVTLQDSLRGIGTVCASVCSQQQPLDETTMAVLSSGVRHVLRCGQLCRPAPKWLT